MVHLNWKKLPGELQQKLQEVVNSFDVKANELQSARTVFDHDYRVHYYVDRDIGGIYVYIELLKIERPELPETIPEIIDKTKKYLETVE